MGIRKSGIGLAVGLWLVCANAAALPPEHEATRLMMAIESAIDQSQWDQASRYLNRLQNLQVQKPTDYLFFRGRVMHHSGQLNEARDALEDYVVQAGADGEHYRQALGLITDIERQLEQQSQQKQHEPVAQIKPAETVDVDKLQELYLKDNPVDALVAHLNSLLSLHAYQGDRILRDRPRQGVVYELEVTGPGELTLRTTDYQGEGRAVTRTQTLSVYGVSPLVEQDCLASEGACWIYDPRDNTRWLKLALKPDAANAITRAMGELIRRLQETSR
ncbi:hypothetical protein QQM79_13020 [Marinobacteraceae bacterium S3BR75-40.1]